MSQQLTELLEKITPLPWEKRAGDPASENEVCFVRGVTIFGPRKAAACGDDARYIEHAANTLPRLINAVREIITRHDAFSAKGKDLGGCGCGCCKLLKPAIAAAEEVKDHSEQLTPTHVHDWDFNDQETFQP